MTPRTYIRNVLVAFDQFCNTVVGGRPDETLSARAGMALEVGGGWGWRALGRALDWFFPGHTRAAIRHDEARAEAVEKALRLSSECLRCRNKDSAKP